MRPTKARILLETLETRALLTTSAGFCFVAPQVVSDNVGKVDVFVQVFSDNASTPTPETVTIATSGLTAVPGVDYTPVQQTLTLLPDASSKLSIPILPGPASLGTRTLQVTISPTPGAPQGASQLIVITHGADTSAPYVLNSQALTQGGNVVAFSLQFSEPLEMSRATNLANYGVAAPRSLREVLDLATSASDTLKYSKTIALKSATYDAATSTVYLVPLSKVKPTSLRTPYPFQIASPTASLGFSNLSDTSGNPVASGDPSNLFSSVGRFSATPRVIKASPALLTSILGTPAATTATPKAKAHHPHKVK